MGFNAVEVGFPDVEAMVNDMCESEDLQFEAIVEFIKKNNLSQYLQQGDWSNFAFHYNGPDFQKNNYATKLKKAFARFSVGPLPSLQVRAAQLYLTYLKYNPGGVDGWFGKKTQNALTRFQQDKALAPSDNLDDATITALERAATG